MGPVPFCGRSWLFSFERHARRVPSGETRMTDDNEYSRLPGLFRVWDIQAFLSEAGDYRIHFV